MKTWQIISAVDFVENETVIRTLAGHTLPTVYQRATPSCDHCKQNRNRKTVYILLSNSGEYAQVGSTCLRDYTGQDDSELVGSFREKLATDEDERIRQSRMLRTVNYVSRVAMIIRTQGWMSATKARETGTSCTADEARETRYSDDDLLTADDVSTATTALAWAQALPDAECVGNDYLHNLHVLSGQYAIEPKHCHLIASVIVAHRKSVERATELTAKSQSAHFGTVGARATFTLTVERVNSIDTQFGMTNVHAMRDDDGNVAVWFASREKLDTGKRYTLTATVKKHDCYNGISQTTLTRCKVA